MINKTSNNIEDRPTVVDSCFFILLNWGMEVLALKDSGHTSCSFLGETK